MLKFAVENFKEIAKELAPLFVRHWHESALDRDRFKLAPWWAEYDRMQDAGILHVVTVRHKEAPETRAFIPPAADCAPGAQVLRGQKKAAQDDKPTQEGRLVGYFMCLVAPHFHYAESGPMAFTDAYFIEPQFRRGGTGAKLIAELERTLKSRGVVKIYLSTKVHSDLGKLFEAMGYKNSDRIFIKTLR